MHVAQTQAPVRYNLQCSMPTYSRDGSVLLACEIGLGRAVTFAFKLTVCLQAWGLRSQGLFQDLYSQCHCGRSVALRMICCNPFVVIICCNNGNHIYSLNRRDETLDTFSLCCRVVQCRLINMILSWLVAGPTSCIEAYCIVSSCDYSV